MMTDTVDSTLINALRTEPRGSFRSIGAVLGESEQAVARRYRKLVASGRARVVATYRDSRAQPWSLRLTCAPDVTRKVAMLLAERRETSWVHLLAGGTGIVSLAQVADTSLLLERLARNTVHVEAQLLLHAFRLPSGSTRARKPALLLDAVDQAILTALEPDARASCALIASKVGASEATARRRLERLIAAGAVEFEVEEPFAGLETRLWLSVAPAALARTGEALARMKEVLFVAATTGNTNLTAVVRTANAAGLYRFLATKLPPVTSIETSPIASTLKRGGRTLPTIV